MTKLHMPVECRQIVVAYNKSFRIFKSTNAVERFCRQYRLEVVGTESQYGSYIITLKKADSTI